MICLFTKVCFYGKMEQVIIVKTYKKTIGKFASIFTQVIVIAVLIILISSIILINSRKSLELVPVIFITGVISILAFSCIVIIISLILNSIRKKSLSGILNVDGYSDEYFSKLNKIVDKSKNQNKVFAMLSLAGELSDAGRSKEAIKVLKKIDLSYASDEIIAEYYNAYIYILTLGGDLENAETAYGAGKILLDKIKNKKSNSGTIFHTLGVLEYAKGNIVKAENYFISAKMYTKMQEVENTCNMYLALIYLKTGRREYAKKITVDTIPYIENPRQKQDMIKLMKLVETSYGLS